MKFGLNFSPVMNPEKKSASTYYKETIELSVLGEAMGFDHTQTVEHHGSFYGGYCSDPVVLLTAMALATKTIRIVTGAVIPAFIHPLKLAGKLAMLDNLSGGRLDVGFGRGFLPDEFDWFQVPMGESHERFWEGVEACQRLWSEKDVVHKGKYHAFGPITLQPRMLRDTCPKIYIASAMSKDSCIEAGAKGHSLQVVPSITSREQLQDMIAAYRKAYREKMGEDARPDIQTKYTCYLQEDRNKAYALAEQFETNYVREMQSAIASWGQTQSASYPGYEKLIEKVKLYDFKKSVADNKVIVGTPSEVIEQIGLIREWFGHDLTISLQFSAGYMDVEDSKASMRLFEKHVMPAFA